MLLFYDYEKEEFSVSYDIWKEIEQKFYLNDKEINILLTAILEEYFKYNVNTTGLLYKYEFIYKND